MDNKEEEERNHMGNKWLGRRPASIGLSVKGSKRTDVEDQSQLNGEGSAAIMASQARWNSAKSPGTDTNSTKGAKKPPSDNTPQPSQ